MEWKREMFEETKLLRLNCVNYSQWNYLEIYSFGRIHFRWPCRFLQWFLFCSNCSKNDFSLWMSRLRTTFISIHRICAIWIKRATYSVVPRIVLFWNNLLFIHWSISRCLFWWRCDDHIPTSHFMLQSFNILSPSSFFFAPMWIIHIKTWIITFRLAKCLTLFFILARKKRARTHRIFP